MMMEAKTNKRFENGTGRMTRTAPIFMAISEILSVLVFLAGCAVLMGWVLDIPPLKSVFPNLVSMKANTALCFALIGFSLWLLQIKRKDNRYFQILIESGSCVICGIGLLTLSEYLFGWNLGIDQLLFKEPPGAILTSSPGRMAFNTAINFTIVGLSLFALTSKAKNRCFASQLLLLPVGAITLLSLIGYLYRADPLFIGLHFSTAMALHTVVLFLLVFLGGFFCRPGFGLMALISSDALGGKIIRRLLPVTILLPVILGWLKLSGERAGVLSNELGVTFVATANLTFVSVYVYLLSLWLDKADAQIKCSTEALRASEQSYRRLFEASKDGILIADFDTAIIDDVNEALVELLDCPKSELLGKKFWDAAIFKDSTAAKEAFQSLQFQDYLRYEDLAFETGSGKKIDAEFIGNVYFVGSRKVIQCGIRDIAERKRMEAELARVREQQYLTLIENLPQKVFLKDKNSAYVSCNENFARDLKITPAEIAGRTDYDFFPANLAEKYRADDQRIMESGQTESFEEEYAAGDGFSEGVCKGVVNTIKIPIRDKFGRVTGLFGLFWDITEWKRAQDELKLSEEKFRTIFNNASDGILLADPESKRFLMGNPAISQMLGYSMEEITDLSLRDIHPEKALPYVLGQFESIVRGELRVSRDLPVKRKDGTIFSADIDSAAITIGGKQYLMGFVHDLTEQKMYEEEKSRIELLKVSSQIKSKFASMVSHEFRSPLAVILEALDLLLDGLVGTVSEEQKDLLETARANVDRLGRLISNVLDFQKIEAGKMEFHMRGNDINEAVCEVQRSMAMLSRRKDLGFYLELGEQLPKVPFDRDKIVQVLTNLVSNAIKYTERGSVTIRTATENGWIHVSVRDTGIGIATEDMNKLFLAFEQLDSILGKKKGGTGLGLAISKEIILAHKGKIWAESDEGKGSTFHFSLPVEPNARDERSC